MTHLGCLSRQADIQQIQGRGMSLEQIAAHLELFRTEISGVTLARPCTLGDGIQVLEKHQMEQYEVAWRRAADAGRLSKMVPASGAASRMFQLLLAAGERLAVLPAQPSGQNEWAAENEEKGKAKENGEEHIYQGLVQFMHNLDRFAFAPALQSCAAAHGTDLNNLLAHRRYQEILDVLLTSRGLGYTTLPKGLIPFHRYANHVRTPLDEHLMEATAYTSDAQGNATIHFSVPETSLQDVQDYVACVRSRYEQSHCTLAVTFSTQKPSTDTIAVDAENEPFRDAEGSLVFRPGGHGALLENLNELGGDIVFIKNIDNVLPDRLAAEMYHYKKMTCGYFVLVQDALFLQLRRLRQCPAGLIEAEVLAEAFAFARSHLSLVPPDSLRHQPAAVQRRFLIQKLNRPLRVAGMVRNTGEPGGGPFWAEQADGSLSLQIVEASQVDLGSPVQRAAWESATHFNPVDLVCGVQDYRGQPFDLLQFCDPTTGFIADKSKDGRSLRALELPGLWNGAMANWNTAFVEVPLQTFQPVKTVLDLLRPEHQAC